MIDRNILPDCNYCDYCSPKENEQYDTREYHMCTYYNERLMHWWNPHGKLYPCEQCVSDKLGNRKCELLLTRRNIK